MTPRGYLVVFGALMVLTAVTVVTGMAQLPEASTVAVGLLVASAKAALVALFFMHLKGERMMIVLPLVLTAVLVAALFGFILLSEADHVVGPQTGL